MVRAVDVGVTIDATTLGDEPRVIYALTGSSVLSPFDFSVAQGALGWRYRFVMEANQRAEGRPMALGALALQSGAAGMLDCDLGPAAGSGNDRGNK